MTFHIPRFVGLVAIAFLVSACTYQTTTRPTAPQKVYTDYDTKIPGKAALVVKAAKMRHEVKGCGSHVFPVDAREPMKISTVNALEEVFESVVLLETAPPNFQAGTSGYDVLIIAEVESLDVDLNIERGFWESDIESEAEIAIAFTADTLGGRQVGGTLQGRDSALSGAGQACEGGSVAVGQSVEKSMARTLTLLAERLGNSARLREATPAR